jgi:hypothetical protein
LPSEPIASPTGRPPIGTRERISVAGLNHPHLTAGLATRDEDNAVRADGRGDRAGREVEAIGNRHSGGVDRHHLVQGVEQHVCPLPGGIDNDAGRTAADLDFAQDRAGVCVQGPHDAARFGGCVQNISVRARANREARQLAADLHTSGLATNSDPSKFTAARRRERDRVRPGGDDKSGAIATNARVPSVENATASGPSPSWKWRS